MVRCSSTPTRTPSAHRGGSSGATAKTSAPGLSPPWPFRYRRGGGNNDALVVHHVGRAGDLDPGQLPRFAGFIHARRWDERTSR